MTKDEKDSVDTETSRTDDPVDSQPRVEHEGRQNQPVENLPQPSAGSSQSCSGGPVEEDVNVIQEANEEANEEENEELPDENPSEEDPRSTLSEFFWITILRDLFRGICEYCVGKCRAFVSRCWTFAKPYCDNWIVPQMKLFVDNVLKNPIIHLIYLATAIFSLGIGFSFPKYLDFGYIIFCVVTGTFFLSCFERCAHYSKVTERVAGRWPCISECCIGEQIPHRPSQFYRSVSTETRFEHEVADAPPDEAPPDEASRMVHRNEESDLSHSFESPGSPKEVNVYSNEEFPGCSEGASGYTPSKELASEYPPSEEFARGDARELARREAREEARRDALRDAGEVALGDAGEVAHRDPRELGAIPKTTNRRPPTTEG